MRNGKISALALLIILCGFLSVTTRTAHAATLCVNPAGTSGCSKTIGAAVAAAAANDTVSVSPGKYAEEVVIGKPLSLIGANRASTVIDATGLSVGIYIDGIDNPGLSDVVVTGFTVENAKYEGILVANASSVVISNNRVTANNKALNPSGPSCPGIPSFETAEGFDCGEGVHLSGVDHSTVVNNVVDGNAGGILLTDDTAATHDNLITNNTAINNPFDCGITLASHPPATLTGATGPLGVFHNTISQNQASFNGVSGVGAGVGLFDSVPGAATYGNVVSYNRITGNGLPGVALHSHTPGQNLNDNSILANRISGNGADSGDSATPGSAGINVFGVSPITGTIISHNLIQNESIDVVINTAAKVELHLNNLLGTGNGVQNIGSGTANATSNWWGCSGGANAAGCTKTEGSGILTAPSLTIPFTPRRFVF